jgi:hypothetical protein
VFVITCDVGFPNLIPRRSPDSEIIYYISVISSIARKYNIHTFIMGVKASGIEYDREIGL